MSIYLHDIPLQEAMDKLFRSLGDHGLLGILGREKISLDEKALGRVLSAPIWAKISSPHYHASAMDGFAVRAEDTIGALPSQPGSLDGEKQAAYLDTGDPLPGWANAVIPIEQVESLDQGGQIASNPRRPANILIRSAVVPWSHVRTLGEDIVATQLVIPSGQSLRPVDLGAIAASGFDQIEVSRQPRVAILPTGTELVQIGEEIKEGSVIEYNSLVLAAQVNSWGATAFRLPSVPDQLDLIKKQVREAADHYDLVLINAGSSAGSEDFTAQVVKELGNLLVHGVAVRPGHPVVLGMLQTSSIDKWIPVIGVPGYPVSAALTGEIFVEPLLATWLGRQPTRFNEISATLTRKVTSPSGDDDYLRLAVAKMDDRFIAAPLTRGAGVISSLVKADGITIIERGKQGLEAGSQVRVRLYRSIPELENTILAIGSHDISLDLLSQYLANYGRRLTSANVGSLGGLIALKRGESHLAGSHLLDPETGEYNVSFVKQYLADLPVKLMIWLYRQQGLIVKKGNPKHIHKIDDLLRPDVTLINRQRGSGTRVLLDYQANLLGIKVDEIVGYQNEEYTHLAVAAAVASGRADCGMGIAAAAQALEMDFIPLFEERYDLVIPVKYLESKILDPVLDLSSSEQFKAELSKYPGYSTKDMGKFISI